MSNIKTYGDLLDQLKKLTEKELESDIVVYDFLKDSFYDCSLDFNKFSDEDILNQNRHFIRIDGLTEEDNNPLSIFMLDSGY